MTAHSETNTTAPVATMLTDAGLFKRVLDAPPRVGEDRFTPVWQGDEHLPSAREWFLQHAGWGEYLDREWSEMILELLEESAAPTEDMDLVIASLVDALEAMKAIRVAFGHALEVREAA